MVVYCDILSDVKFLHFYYIDTSVLLENIPLVKFIKTTSETWVVYFPYLTHEFIADVILVFVGIFLFGK